MSLGEATMATGVDESERILAELVERYVARLHGGESLDPESFAAEHPDHARALLELLPAAATIARLRGPTPRAAALPSGFRIESDSIGDYQIVREVGRGGMGVVYEAVQATLGRKVALKVLPIYSANDPRQVERFRVEGQAAAALDHPHIVPVYEIGCERGVHFYAMRFIDGESLAAVILKARSGPGIAITTHREAARLALEAAEALAHAHDLGILHRDVKPANLLLDTAGHLWVADFGLARFLDGGDLTRTGDVIGTLRYLSPEQARGRRSLDPRTDVYSLGATLYELATLRPAFDGLDRQDLLRRIVEVEPIPPRNLDPTIPRDLETILGASMAKEVDDRYGSATEFAEDLRRFLDGRPILARRPGLATRASRWARRNRGGVAFALTVVALFLLGTTVGLGFLWREQVRTRENLRVALIALDEFCLSTTGLELTRDPERVQDVQDLQLRALTIYERMLRENPADREARWAAEQAEHRVANLLAKSPRFAEAEAAYRSAHQNLAILLAADPGHLPYRQESADLLADWGSRQPAGAPDAQKHRRQAMAEHLRLASEFPGDPRYPRALARDSIEVARSIGIVKPAEAVEKEALFRKAVELRQAADDRSFDGRGELAEALAFLGHLLNATARTPEGGGVMSRGRSILATLQAESAGDPLRRVRVHALDDLFTIPRYCDPSPDEEETLKVHRSSVEGEARLVAEFPYIPEYRAKLAWGQHALAMTLETFGRTSEAEESERRAVAMFDGLIRDHPTVDHYRRWANRALLGLSRIISGTGRDGEARELARHAGEIVAEAIRNRGRRLGAAETLDARGR